MIIMMPLAMPTMVLILTIVSPMIVIAVLGPTIVIIMIVVIVMIAMTVVIVVIVSFYVHCNVDQGVLCVAMTVHRCIVEGVVDYTIPSIHQDGHRARIIGVASVRVKRQVCSRCQRDHISDRTGLTIHKLMVKATAAKKKINTVHGYPQAR